MLDSNKHLPWRRDFLKASSAIAVGLVSGCTGGDGGDGNADGDTPTGGDGGDSGTDTPTESDGGDGGTETATDSGDGGSDFPSQDITWIIPYGTGGGFDTYSRAIAQYMPNFLPNEVGVVPQNVTGAGGRRGASEIHRSEPNGYTIGIWNIPGMLISQLVLDDVGYALQNVSWIGRVARGQYLLTAASRTNLETVEDFQNADTVIFTATGPGSSAYLFSLIFTDALGINAEFVTGYGSSQEMAAALVRGDADAMLIGADSVQEQVESGDLRPIVHFQEEPPVFTEDTPSIAEVGHEQLVGTIGNHRLVGGPPDIPDERLTVLEESFIETMNSDQMQQFSEDTGRHINPVGSERAQGIIQTSFDTYSQYTDLLEDQFG